MRISLICFIALLLASCTAPAPSHSSDTPEKATSSSSVRADTFAFKTHCFQQRLPDGSVISLQLTEYFDQVLGILDYSFAEKDGAHGTLKGYKQDSLVVATWNYTIEGSEQAEEVIFVLSDIQARKKNGELVEKEGVLVLKDPQTGDYEDPLPKVSCD